jgi:hypothetical protein
MNEEYGEVWHDDEPPFEDDNAAWHESKIVGGPDDEIVLVHESTNDDYDYGYASKFAHWTSEFRTKDGVSALERAIKHTGVSRHGVGCEVRVLLNGQILDQWPIPEPEEPEPAYLVSQRFINWLIVAAVIMVIVWTAFGAFVLPLIPHGPVRASIALLGFGSTFVLGALLLLRRCRPQGPDDDERR